MSTETDTTSVRVIGTQYLVVLNGQSHVVGKDKRCHTCPDTGEVCPAVYAVARHLKEGGRRAPDTLSHPPRPPARALPACPICGSPVEAVPALDKVKDGRGWRCTEGGYAHFYLHRYGHLKEWFCGEGARRHAMFIPDEPPAATPAQATQHTTANVLPFVGRHQENQPQPRKNAA